MSLPRKSLTRIRALLSAPYRRLTNDSGNVLIIVVLAMPVIMAVSAFAIDVANVWAARQHVQSAADAAALAGAEVLGEKNATVTSAQSTAITYVDDNLGVNNPTVTRSASADSSNSTVSVDIYQNVPMFFSGLFGLHDATVHASATAANTSTVTIANDPTDYVGTKGGYTPTGTSWANFCANDGSSTDSTTLVNNQGGGCPTGSDHSVLTDPSTGDVVLTVAHGGVDISPGGSFINGESDAKGNPTVMIDLTGTCVEASASSGVCDNNADGEVELKITNLVPGASYTLSFYLNANTGGLPLEKPMAVAVSKLDFSSLPAMANTVGGTTKYQLESDMSSLIAYREFAYLSSSSNIGSYANTQPWALETISFTDPTNTNTLYAAFGSLENCVKDNSTTLTTGSFTSGLASGTAAQLADDMKFVAPPAQSNDNPNAGKGGCRFGAALSDWSISPTSAATVALTR